MPCHTDTNDCNTILIMLQYSTQKESVRGDRLVNSEQE